MKKRNKNMSIRVSSKMRLILAVPLVVASCFYDIAHAARRERARMPEHTATLTVKVAFDGEGSWRHPSNGAYSEMKFHRTIGYAVPLKGTYCAASGIRNVDRSEQKSGPLIPNVKRYVVLKPRDLLAPVNRVCGKGTTEVLDQAQGMAVGDPGMPPLVPFTRTIKGGGDFPSGDKTVTERDLCEVSVVIDNDKRVMHLSIDGTDSTVKVKDQTNDLAPQSYNLPLQGYAVNASVKKQLTFIDLPLTGGGNTFEGNKVIEQFNTVDGPDHSAFPLRATVEWHVTLDKMGDE